MSEVNLFTALGPVFAEAATLEGAAGRGEWSDAGWQLLAESGIPWVGLPETLGGEGGDLTDAYQLLFLAGQHGTRLPLLETAVVVGPVLAAAERPIPREPLSWGASGLTELSVSRAGAGWNLSGRLTRVPWAAHARWVLGTALLDGAEYAVLIDPADVVIEPGHNLARERRDTVVIDDLELPADRVFLLPPGHAHADLHRRAALAKAVQMVGALDRVQDLTAAYARTRHQFGRPIGRFQAVGQNLALAVEHVQRARLAVLSSAYLAAESGHGEEVVARAKILAGEATDVVTRAAHQIHGAIGVTEEYPLGGYSARLWSWQQEYGSAAWWADRLGGMLLRGGTDALWEGLTSGLATEPVAEARR